MIEENQGEAQSRRPIFYSMSFTYDFNIMTEDQTYFSYAYPYTFTRLCRFIKDLKGVSGIMKDRTPFCQSLSGIDVPYLIVTSRIDHENYDAIMPSEHQPDDLPVQKKKKTVILTGRVHPGESNASFMMEGFIKFITNKTDPIA